MKNIALFIPARLTSERLPRKLVRPFDGTTLIDIGLRTLHKIKFPCAKYFLAYDDILLQKNKFKDIITIKRSKDSAECDGPLTRSFGDLIQVQEDYIALLNPCFPLLRPTTMDSALQFFAENECGSMTSVVRHKNWFFDAETKRCLTPINYKELSTKQCRPILAVGNAFHMVSKKSFFETGQLLNEETYLYEIPYCDSFDVDDLSGFIVAEALYKGRKRVWALIQSLEGEKG